MQTIHLLAIDVSPDSVENTLAPRAFLTFFAGVDGERKSRYMPPTSALVMTIELMSAVMV